MSAQLNHTIVWCRDKQVSARYLTDLLGLPDAEPFGPMLVVQLDNSVSLDFYDHDEKIALQHYAFLMGDEDFDAAFGEQFQLPCGHRTSLITTPSGQSRRPTSNSPSARRAPGRPYRK